MFLKKTMLLKYEQEQHKTKSLALSVTQLAGCVLLKMLKHFASCVKLFKNFLTCKKLQNLHWFMQISFHESPNQVP